MTEEKKRKNKKKRDWFTWILVVLVIVGGIYVASNPSGGEDKSDEEVAKCIANKSTLYIQLGCHACETQEDILGDNYKYFDVIDCFYEQNKCVEMNITATPTWIINGERYKGYKRMDKLKELADC